MNKRDILSVSKQMPFLKLLSLTLLAALPLLLGSCSSSRLIDGDQVFEPGSHRVRSLIDSDVLILNGATLDSDYLVGNRIFIASGGSLTGLSKGARNSTIYAEAGANYPNKNGNRTVRLRTIDNAEAAYNDRFRNTLPADAQGSNPNGVNGVIGGPVILGGAGLYYRGGSRRRFGGGSRNFSRGSSRPSSVRLDSFRSRN